MFMLLWTQEMLLQNISSAIFSIMPLQWFHQLLSRYQNQNLSCSCCYFLTKIFKLLNAFLSDLLQIWVLNTVSPSFIYIYTRCPRRNVPNFGRVFLRLKYTNITQNTYIQSWTVTEIMAGEVWNFDSCYTLIDYQIHIKTGRNMWFL